MTMPDLRNSQLIFNGLTQEQTAFFMPEVTVRMKNTKNDHNTAQDCTVNPSKKCEQAVSLILFLSIKQRIQADSANLLDQRDYYFDKYSTVCCMLAQTVRLKADCLAWLLYWSICAYCFK